MCLYACVDHLQTPLILILLVHDRKINVRGRWGDKTDKKSLQGSTKMRMQSRLRYSLILKAPHFTKDRSYAANCKTTD